MSSTIKKKATGSRQAAKIAKGSGKIPCYFPNSQESSPAPKMVAPCGMSRTSPDPGVQPASPAASVSSDYYADSPMAFRSVPGPSSQPLTLCIHSDLRALLHALPTKADIEALFGRLEEQHHKDFVEVRWEVQTLSS